MDEQEIVTHRSTAHLAWAWSMIAPVGWYIFALIVGLFFASPYLSDKYESWKEKKESKAYAEKYHKNPDLAEERLRSLEAARQRMQEKYAQAAEIAKQKEEAKKEAKKQELLKLSKGLDGGRKLGADDKSASTSKSSKLNEGYNPLMGDTGRGYRAPKRSCCKKGGGCG